MPGCVLPHSFPDESIESSHKNIRSNARVFHPLIFRVFSRFFTLFLSLVLSVIVLFACLLHRASFCLLSSFFPPPNPFLTARTVLTALFPSLSIILPIMTAVPPRFTSKFQSQTVRLAESTVIKCEAVGDQPLSIEWMHDKNPLKFLSKEHSTTRIERQDESNEKNASSSLKIVRAQRSDSGIFTCLVNNSYGDDQAIIQLIVQEPPEPPRDVKILERYSRSVKFSWSLPFNGNSQILKHWITCVTSSK